MDDTQIIALFFSRMESAITETAKKYGSYLNQVAYNILRCPEDAEEVVEDTYFAAWNAIPPERPRVLRHYLSRITRNLSLSRLDYLTAKRRNPHMVMLLSELEDCIPDPEGSVERAIEAHQLALTLNQFLSGLEHLDCAVFLCRYYCSMTIEQISDKYQLPKRNVKYRLSRLRQKLRMHLTREGICV